MTSNALVNTQRSLGFRINYKGTLFDVMNQKKICEYTPCSRFVSFIFIEGRNFEVDHGIPFPVVFHLLQLSLSRGHGLSKPHSAVQTHFWQWIRRWAQQKPRAVQNPNLNVTKLGVLTQKLHFRYCAGRKLLISFSSFFSISFKIIINKSHQKIGQLHDFLM